MMRFPSISHNVISLCVCCKVRNCIFSAKIMLMRTVNVKLLHNLQ